MRFEKERSVMSDWPDDTVGWFDDKNTVWCHMHEPESAAVVGEVTPVLKSDSWDVGPCSVEDCHKFVGGGGSDG